MGLITDGDCDDDGDATMKVQSSNSRQHTSLSINGSSVACNGGGGPIDEMASLIFSTYFANNNAEADRGDDSDEQQQQRLQRWIFHTNNFNYKVICHGDVREAYGIHYSDKHDPLSTLKTHYPNLYYHRSSLSVDEDNLGMMLKYGYDSLL